MLGGSKDQQPLRQAREALQLVEHDLRVRDRLRVGRSRSKELGVSPGTVIGVRNPCDASRTNSRCRSSIRCSRSARLRASSTAA